MTSKRLHTRNTKPQNDPRLRSLIGTMKRLHLNKRAVLQVSYEQTQRGIEPSLEVCIEERNRAGSHQHAVHRPKSDRGRIRVIKQEVKVCVKPKWIYVETETPRIVRRLYHVRLLQPRRFFRSCIYSSKSRKTAADSPPKEDSSTLRLRGGGSGSSKKKERQPLGDDDPIPAHVWWFAGGKPGHKPPTKNQVRRWKERSRGDWDEGKKRGFFQEIAYVLSDGRHGKDQRRPRKKEKKQNGGQEGNGRSTQGSSVSYTSDERV